MSCPHCGSPLHLHLSLNSSMAPWQCNACRHAFWPSELTPEARQLWRPELESHDPTDPGYPALRKSVATELEGFAALSINFPLHYLKLLNKAQLTALVQLLSQLTQLPPVILQEAQAILAGM